MSNKVSHPTLGHVELRLSSRARRISIAVLPSGEVRLNIPMTATTKTALAYLDSKIEWIKNTQAKIKIKVESQKRSCRAVITSETTIEQKRKLLQEAVEYLPKRVGNIARAISLDYKELRIGKATSLWGSCRNDGRISLTFYIMGLPTHLIDFVIIHELCHTVHHNHSPRFHELVNRMTGGREKDLERELKGWKIYLP